MPIKIVNIELDGRNQSIFLLFKANTAPAKLCDCTSAAILKGSMVLGIKEVKVEKKD